MSQPELILFARQPIAGQAKTRLQPQYSPECAAEIAAFLIRSTVELAVSAWPGEIMLSVAPDPDYPLFHELAREFGIHLATQAEGDLGDRMLSALRAGIARNGSAAVLGCDVPQCKWEILDQANEWLAKGSNVIGPSEDGGYYFIGLQEPHPELFVAMPWGSSRVFEATLARAADMDVEFEQLKKLRDIDTANDLWLVAQIYEPLKKFL
jgi:hypothetical protein